MRCNQCRHLSQEEANIVCRFEDCPHKGSGLPKYEREGIAAKIPETKPERPGRKKVGRWKRFLMILKRTVKGSKYVP
jgi:hypothetical protein